MDGPGFINVDLSVFKNFNFHESRRIQFRSEFFNATNTPRFGSPGGNVNSSTFGRISSASASRQIQFALKFIF